MSQPLPESRRAQIIEELRSHGMQRVTDLSERLGVAPVTVRRDINELAAQGLIRRVHGGAAPVQDPSTTDVEAIPRPTPRPAEGSRIGMLVPSLDYYWPGVIQGAKAEAIARGMVLRLRGTSYEATDDREQISDLLDLGMDGLIIAPDINTEATAELLAWLHESRVPVVLVEREALLALDQMPVESVTTDHIVGARSAMRYLADLGHSRIGLALSRKSPHLHQLQQGWLEAIAQFGLVEGGMWKIDNPAPEVQIDSLIQECVEDGTTALLVHADREAIAIGQRCQKLGFEVGADLSIVAYDDEIAGLFSVPLTAVRPPRASIGKAAVSLLAERMIDPERPTHRVRVSPRLFVRESTARRG